MYCRYCGKEIPNDSNFCPNCGEKQKENVSGFKLRMPQFINEHKKISYVYIGWGLIHVALFLFSSPTGHHYVYGNRRDYDLSNGFYPYNKSIGDILDGQSYNLAFFDNIDVYDFSEFFFYTILVPVSIFGIVKCIPHILPLLKKLKGRYNQWQKSKTKKREEYQGNIVAYKTQQKESLVFEPAKVKPVAEEVVSPYQQKSEGFCDEVTQDEEKAINMASLPQAEHIQDEEAYIHTELTVKKMPLFSRFIGSIIDKILILIIFFVGFIIISPFGAAGRLGTYIGLRNTSLSNYEYIDKAAMNRYGTYRDEVSQYYQDRERLANAPPHIGSTLELDMNITFSFILLNLLFYILFESILSASPGKRMLGGIILDSTDDKIGFGKALTRGLGGGVLMAGTYFLLHLQGGLTNTVVVFVFFLLLDVPVLFTKKSLLDLCTGTTYAKR